MEYLDKIVLVAFATLVGLESCNDPANKNSASSLQDNSVPADMDTSYIRNKPKGEAPNGMVWIPGGKFWMGCETCDMPDAVPLHRVIVDGYWMDETPVTNREYALFVKETGYKTVAERKPDPKDFPGVPLENLVAGSIVFTPPPTDVPLNDISQWWKYIQGANWNHPEGPSSDLKGRENHPVVHVCYEDAAAYAKWAGKRLPTEAEFEYAARGGTEKAKYSWGRELKPGGKWVANIWQGNFPVKDAKEDGYAGTSPVNAFPANGYGLYDISGNVWQWCSDWYRSDYYQTLAQLNGPVKNPKGPAGSYDPQEPGVPKRVQKSGSFLCSDQYCVRYLLGSRGKGEISSAASNIGFRCVKDAISKQQL